MSIRPEQTQAAVIPLPVCPDERARLRQRRATVNAARLSAATNEADAVSDFGSEDAAHDKARSRSKKKGRARKAGKRKGGGGNGGGTARSEKPGSRRGIETLFRTAYDTHLTLHSMADNKARMMIQVNGLILSVLLSAAATWSGEPSSPASAATIPLFAGGAASLLFAVMAARPQSSRKNPRTGKSDSRSGGLLFFSQFSGLTSDDYVASMRALMEEPEALYDSMSRNLHVIGEFLERKYRLLRIAYAALAVGVIGTAGMWFGIPARFIA